MQQNAGIHFLLAGHSDAYFRHSHGLFDKHVEHVLLETCPLNSWMSVSQPVAARTSRWPRRTNYHPLPAESLQRKSEAPERWALKVRSIHGLSIPSHHQALLYLYCPFQHSKITARSICYIYSIYTVSFFPILKSQESLHLLTSQQCKLM